MRELKFRVWDEQINNYRSPNTVSIMSNGKPFIISKMGNKNQKVEILEDIIIEQYTGLKDKNGKEIYEGDILKIHQFLFDGNEIEKEWICVVEYITEHNASGFGVKVISGEFALEHTGYKNYEEMPPFTFSSIYGLHEESFEKIGNIHEKPELCS